jgi:large subunit ribosomal protein L6
MSRVGKKPVAIPAGVTAKVDGQNGLREGPKGELFFVVPDDVAITVEATSITVARAPRPSALARMWGMARAMINNITVGVTRASRRSSRSPASATRRRSRASICSSRSATATT